MKEVNNDDKKRYLRQYLASKRQAALIQEQIHTLRSQQTSPKGLGDGMPKGNLKTDLSNYAAKYDELVSKLENEYEKQKEVYRKIWDLVQISCEGPEREILTRRYLLGETWEEIAVKMNYSFRHVTKMHGKALTKINL